jgi:hypothetical protein
MRRIVATLTLLALMLCAHAQASETARHALLGRMFTTGDYWGFPAETGDPFTCNGATERSTYYNTTSHLPKMCDGTSWVSVGGLTSPVSGDYVWTGKHTFGSAADSAGSVRLGETANCIVFEGATADAFETSACATDPTADTTINFPAFSAGTYTLATLTGTETLSGKTLTTPTIASFANATHDHTNAAGGGTLNAGTALGAGQVSLTRGGTGSDLSGTGGTEQFIKQGSVGGALTAVRPTCSTLSNAAASCSTDMTNMGNAASGTLSLTRGGTGANNSGIAKGGMIVGTGAGAASVLPVGSDGCVPYADSTQTNGITWTCKLGLYYIKTGITNNTFTSIVRFDVASGTMTGAVIFWRITATDGTDFQQRTGTSELSCNNKAGSISVQVNIINTATGAAIVPSGTQTVTSQGLANAATCDFQVSSNSSLAGAATSVTFSFLNLGAQAVTIL